MKSRFMIPADWFRKKEEYERICENMSNMKWVSLWGEAVSSPVDNPERYARDLTLRYIITPTLSGEKLRLTFSNREGYEPVTLTAMTVARTRDDAMNEVRRDSFTAVTFNGLRELTLLPGETVQSDEIPYPVKRGERFSVSIYLADYTEMGTGVNSSGPLSIGYFARGRYSDRLALPPEECKETNIFYFLNTVDVLTEEENHAVIAFGDSITQQSWPEQLTQRILREDIPNVSIVRRAIGGSRVLREYTVLSTLHYGRKGVERFERELSLTSGVSGVIVLHGINDLIHPEPGNPFRPMEDLPTAEELINGLRVYIGAARRHGVKIWFATITPFGRWPSYTDEKEARRQQVNHWIRTNTEADGFVDFAAVTQEEADPRCARTDYNSGDGLHPSMEGACHMAAAIPEEWLK